MVNLVKMVLLPSYSQLAVLLLLCDSLWLTPAIAQGVSSPCTVACAAYSAAFPAPNTTAVSNQCLLDCINCNPKTGSTSSSSSSYESGCQRTFYAQFNSTGAYVGFTCQEDFESLPPWAVVAISLGSLALIAIIIAIVFKFVWRCCKHKIDTQRDIAMRLPTAAAAAHASPVPPPLGTGQAPQKGVAAGYPVLVPSDPLLDAKNMANADGSRTDNATPREGATKPGIEYYVASPAGGATEDKRLQDASAAYFKLADVTK